MTVPATAGRFRPVDGTVLAILLATVMLGVLAVPYLPETMRIHWAAGERIYYGVETVPRALGVALVPAIGAVLYGVACGLARIDPVGAAIDEARIVYDATLLATVAVLGLVQAAVILLNLG